MNISSGASLSANKVKVAFGGYAAEGIPEQPPFDGIPMGGRRNSSMSDMSLVSDDSLFGMGPGGTPT